MHLKYFLAISIFLISYSDQSYSSDFSVEVSAGAMAMPEKPSISDLSERWPGNFSVRAVKYKSGGKTDEVNVTSCAEMFVAKRDWRIFDASTRDIGDALQATEYCWKLSWLLNAKQAKHNEFPSKLCLDRKLYIILAKNLDRLWGSDDIETVTTTSCDKLSTHAEVVYRKIIEPKNEWIDEGIKSGHVYLRFEAKGDIDSDGWQDLIVSIGSGVNLPPDVWYRNGYDHPTLKMSLKDGKWTIEEWNALQHFAAGRRP